MRTPAAELIEQDRATVELGDRMRIGRAFTLLVVVSLFVVLPIAPASAAPDCGSGMDTPPAIHIPNHGQCSGSMEGESYTWSIECGWFCARDQFTFDATLDDEIKITFTTVCARWNTTGGSGGAGTYRFVATKSGPPGFESAPQQYTLNVTATAGFDGGGCGGTDTRYTVRVDVTPNTRPTLHIVSAPATAKPADVTQFRVRATDPENNLSQIGVDLDWPPTNEEIWKTPDASGEVTFDLSFIANRNMRFMARDTIGARANEIPHSVTLVQDDCGTGADIATLSRPFPFTCGAHLSRTMGDESDVYSFDVPAGTARLDVDYARTSGELKSHLVLTPPTGPAIEWDDSGKFVAAEAGAWTLEVWRVSTHTALYADKSYGGYTVGVRPVGAAAPPSLSATLSPAAVHQFDPVTVDVDASDPNDLDYFVNVDWGDGSSDRFPASGFRTGALDESVTHYYAGPAATRTVTVRAENEEALFSTQTFTVDVRTPDDGCDGLAASPTMDAPGNPSSWSAAQNAKFQGLVPESCAGEVGYGLSRSGSTTTFDETDTYRFSLCLTSQICDRIHIPPDPQAETPAGEDVVITYTSGPGLTSNVSYGIGANRILTRTAGPGETVEIRIPAGTPALFYYVYADRVSGRGTYEFDIAHEPPV